jgi:hypothetical protein
MVQYSNFDRVMETRDHFKNGANLKSHMSKENKRISMKTNKLLILFILNVFFFSSCEKNEMDNNSVIRDYRVNDVLYSKNANLKQVSVQYGNCGINSGTIWYLEQEYEYDDMGRISKVSRPMYEDGKIKGVISYDIYVYNDKYQLEKIAYYNANLYAGFLNLQTHIYSYDKDGNKLKTLIEYPVISKTDSVLYFYEKDRLVRENKYDSGPFESYGVMYINGGLVSYIEYEYDSYDNLVKETTYSGTDNSPLLISNHSYQNGLNVKTEVFTYYNIIGKTKLREIRRYYDENDNLIYLESNEVSMLSSTMGFVAKYEYY